MVTHFYDALALKMGNQERGRFKARLGYTARLSQKEKKTLGKKLS